MGPSLIVCISQRGNEEKRNNYWVLDPTRYLRTRFPISEIIGADISCRRQVDNSALSPVIKKINLFSDQTSSRIGTRLQVTCYVQDPINIASFFVAKLCHIFANYKITIIAINTAIRSRFVLRYVLCSLHQSNVKAKKNTNIFKNLRKQNN